MNLIDYPDSDNEQDLTEDRELTTDSTSLSPLKRKSGATEVGEKCVKVKHPPPLPLNFHTLYATNTRTSTSDDPSLHGGRQRQIPHVEGNWPSFVYLEWLPSEQDLTTIERVIDVSTPRQKLDSDSVAHHAHFHSFLRSDLNVRLPLHISLSSPLILRTENKDDFEKSLTMAIREAKIDDFSVSPMDLKWVSNFDQTRHFLILVLARPPKNELNTLLEICNEVCQKFNLPQLYSVSKSVGVQTRVTTDDENDPSAQELVPMTDKFHISIGWTLEKPEANFDHSFSAELDGHLQITFDNLRVKVGNHVSTVAFDRRSKIFHKNELVPDKKHTTRMCEETTFSDTTCWFPMSCAHDEKAYMRCK